MRAVVTRVNSARVTRAETGEVLGEIGKGFLVLLGVHVDLSLIHISEPTRQAALSRMPSSA